jgi:DNA polymerase elongation subunit (family B)
MTSFYTDVSLHRNHVLLRGYENNKRIKRTIPFKPYLYIPSKVKSDYKTLEGTYVERVNFDSIYEARDFIREYKDVSNFKIYGMSNFDYLFLSDAYPKEVQYNTDYISIVYIDIEVAKAADGSFADVLLANGEVNAITLRKNNKSVCLGLKAYYPQDNNVEYVLCEDEADLLRKFIFYWNHEDWQPDIISGWNIEGYDLPYLVRRISIVLGEESAKKLSPWGVIDTKNIFVRGKQQELFFPVGIQVLDYMQVYKKFSFKLQESYALDYIASVELNEKKVDYSEYGSLDKLYKLNPDLYYYYNIHDCALVARLEDKLGMIKQIITSAFIMKCNFNDIFATVKPWDCYIHSYLKQRNIVIPPVEHKDFIPYEGAYVKEINPSVYGWIASFDVASMYPHIIQLCNISPETFVRKMKGVNVDFLLNNGIKTEQLKHENLAIAANGSLYRKDIHGFLPELMKNMYDLRVSYRKRMNDAKRKKEAGDNSEEIIREISTCNNTQQALKIAINSAYGAIANEYFRYYSQENAEAITLTGQFIIKFIAKKIDDYLNHMLKTKNIEYCCYSDTDSVYVVLDNVVQHIAKPTDTKNQIATKIDLFCKNILEVKIKTWFDEMGEYINCYEQKISMKREVICDRAVWRAKKNYILNVLDEEGIRFKTPKLKIVGIEAIKSSTPLVCRNALKELFGILMNNDKQKVIRYVNKFKSEFEKMNFEQVAKPGGIKVLNHYADSRTVYKHATPIHARAALLYNKALKEKGLDVKYPLIYNSDKIKWAYLKMPNPIGENVFAISTELPKELELEKYIDYELQFRKVFLDVVESITEIFGWDLEEKASLEDFFA